APTDPLQRYRVRGLTLHSVALHHLRLLELNAHHLSSLVMLRSIVSHRYRGDAYPFHWLLLRLVEQLSSFERHHRSAHSPCPHSILLVFSSLVSPCAGCHEALSRRRFDALLL